MTPDDLSRLLSLISHELRAPLGVVRGYLRLLEQRAGALTKEDRQVITAAMNASRHAAELVDQVGQLGHLVPQDAALTLRATPLDRLLDAAIAAARRPEIPDVHVERPAPSDLVVPADQALLSDALASLITAIVRAQPTATTVTVTARREALVNRSGVTIEIATGEARATDAIEGDLDIRRGGLGLGLPLAAAVIHAQHGNVRERSLRGRPVGMVVWLPLSP